MRKLSAALARRHARKHLPEAVERWLLWEGIADEWKPDPFVTNRNFAWYDAVLKHYISRQEAAKHAARVTELVGRL